MSRLKKDGTGKPDFAICNKKERQWLIFEGTVYNIEQIQERDKLKTEKYADLRASLKRLHPGYNVIQVNLVFDFLSGYCKELIHKLCLKFVLCLPDLNVVYHVHKVCLESIQIFVLITTQSSLKEVDHLDITLNPTNKAFQPYRKPNDEPLYINTNLTTHPQ